MTTVVFVAVKVDRISSNDFDEICLLVPES